MNIDRWHAVEIFKQYGGSWYAWAQKFPIDIYKDSILLYEFVNSITLLANHHLPENLNELKSTVRERNIAYRRKDIEHVEYGWIIEMTYRRKINPDNMKAFLQSMLLNTSSITYETYDELKVYIYGAAEAVSVMMAHIIGCAPQWFTHAQSVAEAIWLIQMLYTMWRDNHHGYCYLPYADMQRFGITRQDITQSYRTHMLTSGLYQLIRQYVDQYVTLMEYGLQWITYINPAAREWVLLAIKEHQDLVNKLISLDYNIFHPKFTKGLWSKMISYSIYLIAKLTWKKL